MLDSGATAHYSGASEARRGPYDSRNQGTSEIVIAEFNNKFDSLLSVGALQHQGHPADLLTRQVTNDSRPIYARATSHVRPAPTVETQMRLTAAGNFYQTADISNNYLHLSLSELLVAERQRIGRANYSRNFCHTHCQQVSHNVNQCRSEDIRRRPRQ